MNSRQIRQSFILLLTAVIWGVAFVAQSVGMDYVGPFTFICVRSLIGGLVLLPCITLLDRLNGRQEGTALAGGRTAGSLTLCRTRLSRSRLPDQVIEDSSAGPGYHEAVCRNQEKTIRETD